MTTPTTDRLNHWTAVAPPDGETLPSQAVMVIAHEGEQTADRRLVARGALTWRTPPITLTINHDPEHVAGMLDPIGRVDSVDGLTTENVAERIGAVGDYVVGLVTFDLGYDSQGNLLNPDADGREAARLVDGGFLRGVSMEVGNEEVDFTCLEEDEDGFCISDLMTLLAGQIGAVTLAPFQAIESAEVVDVAGADNSPEAIAASACNGRLGWWPCASPYGSEHGGLIASAVADLPALPPAEAFGNPHLTEYTPLTVDGWRVFGHVAPHDVCHVGIGDYCRTAPLSSTGYAYFHQIPIETDAGQLMVGLLCTDQLHVDLAHDDGSPIEADEARRVAYENPAARAAYLRAGEDEYGIWVSGVLHPNVSPMQLERIEHTPVSGDWRPIRTGSGDFIGTELISVSCVNTPGFPHARALAASLSGEHRVLSVVGALVPHTPCDCGGTTATPAANLETRVQHIETIVDALGLDEQAVAALASALGRPR